MADALVRRDPLSGHLFLFRNKSGDKIKILYWDRDGYAIWYKRLEEGTFRFPTLRSDEVEIETWQLAALLGGIDFSSARRRRRFDGLPEAGK